MAGISKGLGAVADAGRFAGAAGDIGGAASAASRVGGAVGGAANLGKVDLSGISRVGGNATGAGTSAARGADDIAAAGAKGQKATFLAKNANTLLAGGVAAGGLYYLDQQYKGAKEDVKDCMKVCLPGNWDDHAYGDLDKSELQYKELDDAGDQPVCSAEMPDCGKYCGDKCEEIHDYDAPGSDLLTGLGGDTGELAGGLLGGLFGGLGGGLADGLGVDTGVVSASSSSSSLCCCIVLILAAVMSA